MDRPLLMALVIALLLVLLGLMYLGWRARQKRQAGLPAPEAVPTDAGDTAITLEAFYVATTVAGDPLNRVAVGGLGYRARASVSVRQRGVVLAIPGQAEIFIPAAAIRRVEPATWTIDRVVEEGGMVLIAWTLPGDTAVDVDSYFRVSDSEGSAALVLAVQRLLESSSTRGEAV